MFHSRKLILSGALQVFLIFVEQLKHAPLAGSKHPAVFFFTPHFCRRLSDLRSPTMLEAIGSGNVVFMYTKWTYDTYSMP
jgi:hypothetical protein